MKCLLKAIFLMLTVGAACGAPLSIASAPQWKVTLKVIDDTGSPVSQAAVFAECYLPQPDGSPQSVARTPGLTDVNGLAVLAARSGPRIGCGASKDGYYKTTGLTLSFNSSNDGKWQPWDTTRQIVLKKIRKPTAMYAKRVRLSLPAQDKAIAFDLSSGDWVAPYGHGTRSDMIFSSHPYGDSTAPDEDCTLTITFPNSEDGIQMWEAPAFVQETRDGVSALRSAYLAPANNYSPQWVVSDTEKTDSQLGTKMDAHHNYYFRVGSVVDEQGKLKTALYGKIYGEFPNFTYYLNPTPNDRNLEFDPLKDLVHGDHVNEP
jgi:hypothetical protein